MSGIGQETGEDTYEPTAEELEIESMFEKADELMLVDRNYSEALKLYENILTKDPDNIDGLNSKAQCLQKVDKNSFSKALSLYEKALSIEDKDFETNFNIGILHYQRKDKGDLDTALAYLQKAHEIEPSNKIILYNIACIHEEKQEYDKSEGFYKKLL